ncbi:MAG: type II toxin-antitoxin system RelE family toxin [Aminivibrio sp.]
MPPATVRRIFDHMEKVFESDSVRSTGKGLKGNLGNLWRYRVGDYRVICSINDEILLVLVVKIGHRREVYRGVLR